MKFTKTLLILLLLFNSIVFTNKAKCQITVAIDTSIKHQTIFGWGGALRRGTKEFYSQSSSIISQIEDLSFNQLHVNIVRGMCEPAIEPVNDNNDPFVLDTSNLVWTYYDYATKDILAMQRALTISNGRINYIFSTNNSAPAWMKANNNVLDGDTILPTMYDEFTEYISAYLLGLQNRYHIRINGISLFNEPGLSTYYESLTSSPIQVRDLVIKMKSRLLALEDSALLPHIDLIAPESPVVSSTADYPASVGNLALKNCIHYLDSAQGGMFADTNAVNSVDIVGTHNYFDETNTSDWSTLKSVSKNKPLWVTEASTSSFDPYDVTSKNAVVQAKWIHRSFTLADVRAFCMFSFYDTLSTYSNPTSLIIYTSDSIIIPKRYYGFKQFVNFVQPGYVRVDANSNYPNLYVSSYINPAQDTLVIVAINDTNIVLPNITFNCPVSYAPINLFATSDVPNYSTTQLGDIAAPLNGQFTAAMPAMSIQTFIIPLINETNINTINMSTLNLKIYPNPFKDYITIALPDNDVYDINVYDFLGRMLINSTNKTGIVTLDCKYFSTGLYYVLAKNKYVTLSGKIVRY